MRPAKALVALALAASAATARAQPAPSDPLAPLRFLVGEWQAIQNPPGERGGFAFTLSVQNHVMTRTNYAVYAANAARPSSRHDDFMMIYADADVLKADYVDSEGHAIQYIVSSSRANEVVFLCAPTAKGPGYRLSYVLMPEGLLKGQFEVAAPGDRGAFKQYLVWTARRVAK